MAHTANNICHGSIYFFAVLFYFTNLNGETDFPHISVSKETAYNAGDLDLISASRRSPGEGNGNPFQYSCLENPLDRGAW